MTDFLPVAQPDLGPLEEQYVSDAVRSSWIGPTGGFVDRFRIEFAALCGVEHAIPVSNGTVALHVALLALGVERGDEVIVPSLTYIASVNAITYCGAVPVFADVEADSWGLDPAAVEAAVTPRTKAIMAVHLYGMPASMQPLRGWPSGTASRWSRTPPRHRSRRTRGVPRAAWVTSPPSPSSATRS